MDSGYYFYNYYCNNFFNLTILASGVYSYSFDYFKWVNINENIKLFITFLLPTHNFDFLNTEINCSLFYFFDFLGRIFVSYGIYQTIQAFRKYKGI